MKIHAVIAILCLCSSRAFGSDASSRPRGGSFLGMPVLKTGLVILATLFVQAVYDECCAPSQALVNPTAWEQDVRMFNYSQKYSDDEVDEWCGMTELDGYVSYKHKEYRAQYVYTRDERDPLAQCAKTPAVINDVGYKRPFKCVYSRCTADIIFGIWYVETQQYTPRWGPFTDEGCVLCGQKRMVSTLKGLDSSNDRKLSVCQSSPATIEGKHYKQPTYCRFDKITGVFHVPDAKCESLCSSAPAMSM